MAITNHSYQMGKPKAASRIAIALGGLMFLTGCFGGTDGPETVAVTGTVNYKGSPLSKGKIVFESAENKEEQSYGGSIDKGQFNLQSTPGAKKVRITATEMADASTMSAAARQAMETGSEGPVPVQIIPERYNRKTELTANIQGETDTPLTFDLKDE